MKGAARLSCGPAREQRAAADQRQGRVNRGLSPPLPPPVTVPEEMAAALQSVIAAEAGGGSGPEARGQWPAQPAPSTPAVGHQCQS